jgi:segregation and condensation protein B
VSGQDDGVGGPEPSRDSLDSPDTPDAQESLAHQGEGPAQTEVEETLDVSVPGELFGPIEAVLLVVDEPIADVTLAQVLGRPRPEVEDALRSLSESYTKDSRGFDLREVAGGWRLYTREEYAEVVERFVLDGQQARLTQAALETLAVIAYRQPVSRTRVSAIRGVNCDGVVRTLVTRGLVEEAGSDQESGAILYRTTTYFLERLGLRSVEELPSLAPYLPEIDDVEAEHGDVPAGGQQQDDQPAAAPAPSAVVDELPLASDDPPPDLDSTPADDDPRS